MSIKISKGEIVHYVSWQIFIKTAAFTKRFQGIYTVTFVFVYDLVLTICFTNFEVKIVSEI